jgi:hypothetical protein
LIPGRSSSSSLLLLSLLEACWLLLTIMQMGAHTLGLISLAGPCRGMNVLNHKVRIFKSSTVCPLLVGIGTLPTLLSTASVPSPQNGGGGGHTRPRVRGWGSPNIDEWQKKLSTLHTLCTECTVLFSSYFLLQLPILPCAGIFKLLRCPELVFLNFKEPRNCFQGIDSASLCSLSPYL